MRLLHAFLLLSLAAGAALAQQPAPKNEQIALAVMAAPEDRREGAAVLGYNESGELVELRAGSNELICLADDPAKEKISVACYHEDLEPFMKRGRELSAEGLKGMERHKARWREVGEGKVPVPSQPRTLYVLTGSSYDPETGELADSYLRWVIYSPYATPESTGLSTEPSPGAPWLMYPGTAGAHIMINPPRPE